MSKMMFLFATGVAILISMATCALAEDAPVYDVESSDNYPPAFEQSEQAQGYSASVPMSERFTEDTTPSRMNPLTPQQRLLQVEQQIRNLQATNSSAKLEALQAEVRSLRGEFEQLSHELEQLKSAQTAMYSNMQNQVEQVLKKTKTMQAQLQSQEESDSISKSPRDTVPTALPKLLKPIPLEIPDAEATAALATKKTSVASTKIEQPDSAQEQQVYQTAYDLIKAKKYNEAIVTLQSMLKKYPSGQFAANAHYWLGELYGLLNKNEQSAAEFATVVRNYPESSKASDAQLKLGLIYVAEFKWGEAKAAFKKVIAHSPSSASARLAMEQLKQIKKAGH